MRRPISHSWSTFLASAVFLATLALLPYAVFAQVNDTDAPPILDDVGFDQKLDGQLPLDLEFVDETGRTVKLGDYFGERPVILSFVYYECPMLCTLVLNGLTDGLRTLPFSPGSEMQVVTLSIDPDEGPKLAADKKALYMKEYGNEAAAAGWHFLTGKPDAIAALTDAAGFRYAYDADTDEFAHASGIMLATPEGRLSHYLFGIEYPPRDLRLALVEASENRIGSPVDRLMLFCYHYDPVTGKYAAAIMNFVRLGCFATIAALATFLIVMFRRDARAARGEAFATDPSGKAKA